MYCKKLDYFQTDDETITVRDNSSRQPLLPRPIDGRMTTGQNERELDMSAYGWRQCRLVTASSHHRPSRDVHQSRLASTPRLSTPRPTNRPTDPLLQLQSQLSRQQRRHHKQITSQTATNIDNNPRLTTLSQKPCDRYHWQSQQQTTTLQCCTE